MPLTTSHNSSLELNQTTNIDRSRLPSCRLVKIAGELLLVLLVFADTSTHSMPKTSGMLVNAAGVFWIRRGALGVVRAIPGLLLARRGDATIGAAAKTLSNSIYDADIGVS